MTDRISGFIVTLAEDMRDDDAQATLNAIWQIKGVIDCSPALGGIELAMATARAKMQLREKLIGVLK